MWSTAYSSGVISALHFSRVAAAGGLWPSGQRVSKDTIPLRRPVRSGLGAA
ncbi:hypothetical protein E2C01_053174 [Portunus trituberculatus]|uniref:Uncharacterized protein n=1 Tax=Portunus trituberculatus TaxID=210409 RepID=A0A5B7GNG7_PORTR|nr:hypothetical protein [Portunus trituberculatus]